MEIKSQKVNLFVVFLFASLLASGCSGPRNFEYSQDLVSVSDEAKGAETPPPSEQTPTPSPDRDVLRDVTPLWEGKVAGAEEWTAHVDRQLDLLGQDLLDVRPKDDSLFCPKYNTFSYARRKQYWAFLLSSMVHFESQFKTSAKLTEKFTDSSGKKVVSRGLLQISLESGNAYGCGLKSSQDLHDPLKNLSCGIRILNRWVGRDGRIAGKVLVSWRGGARYWAVLRSGDKVSYKSILKWSQNLSICK